MSSALRVVGVGGVDPLHTREKFTWVMDEGAKPNYRRLGARLAAFGDLFRHGDGHGLLLVLPSGGTRLVTKAKEFLPIIVDRITMRVMKEGKVVRELPTTEHLNGMLGSETFLGQFRPVDCVSSRPMYLRDFSLAPPGYSDDGPGNRLLFIGQSPSCAPTTKTIEQFLSVMPFATTADRTNAIAAALTVLLRRRWPGGKPLVLVTATRSHSGKTTITDFMRGETTKAEVMYECIDWPMQVQLHKQLSQDPDIGTIVLDNVRLDSSGGRATCIRSAFLESLVTSPEVRLTSVSVHEPFRGPNDYLTILNTNDGSVSVDMLNRGLPIHLAPTGDVHLTGTAIGNPRYEFLPANRERIEGELRGMIARWKAAGCPLDDSVRHSMAPWAKTIGGILQLAGFRDFLANCEARKNADEPLRAAIGALGAVAPDKPLRPRKWAQLAVNHGLVPILLNQADSKTPKGRERGIGVVLSRHLGSQFSARTEHHQLQLRLEGGYRRWDGAGKPAKKKYVFRVLEKDAIAIEGSEDVSTEA